MNIASHLGRKGLLGSNDFNLVGYVIPTHRCQRNSLAEVWTDMEGKKGRR